MSDEIVVGKWPSAEAHAVAGEPVREIRPDGDGGSEGEPDTCAVCGPECTDRVERVHLAPVGTAIDPVPACAHCRAFYGTVDPESDGESHGLGREDECLVCGAEAGAYVELEFDLLADQVGTDPDEELPGTIAGLLCRGCAGEVGWKIFQLRDHQQGLTDGVFVDDSNEGENERE